jgi:Glyoxalase/Bleomycin resistance protein/Dioxygenase superfamily
MLPAYKPVQLAYFVTDVRAAARRMAATLGAGPFFVLDKIKLDSCDLRGKPGDFVHTSAYGQWGEMMMELVQQDSDGPSPFRDLYAPGEEGIHHVACFVDSTQDAIDDYARAGFTLASRATTMGSEFAFVDTSKVLGHMIEIYVGDARLRGFYDFVRDAARGWDGSNPVRDLSAL